MIKHLKKRCIVLKHKILFFTSLFLITYSGLVAAAKPIKMVFLSPDPEATAFWADVGNFMRAVANDLGIDFEVVYSKGITSTYSIKKDGFRILNSPDKPDFFLTGYWVGVSDKFIKMASERDIKVLLFNTVISKEEHNKVGRPREKYSSWLGHLIPDDLTAGYRLADLLFTQAESQQLITKDNKIQMIGLSGDRSSTVARDRNAGMERRLNATNDDAVMHEMVFAQWSRISAEITISELMLKYPKTNIIWSATDDMALGASDALKKMGIVPGKHVLLGGTDWTDEGVQAVKSGELVATMGGHFMEGGWAMILAYDYYHGHDFKDTMGVEINTAMQEITRDNVNEYYEAFGDRNWDKIDFRKFSKAYNKKLKQYDFSLKGLLRHIHNDVTELRD